MGLNIVQLRSMIRTPLGIMEGDVDLDDDTIDLFLNRSFWFVLDKFPFREKEKLVTFEFQAGIRNYNRPDATENIISLAVVDPNTTTNQHVPMDQITTTMYEDLYNEDPEAQGMPRKYTLEGCIIRAWPTPDSTYSPYTAVLRRNTVLSDLADNNSIPTIPQVWHEIIGYGGLWRAYRHFGDIARADSTEALTNRLISTITPVEEKEKAADTRYARLQVVGNDYDMNYDPDYDDR